MRNRAQIGALFAVALLAGGVARGDPGATDAERIKAAAGEFDAGRRAFKAKDYEAAAGHFENADRDAPAPEALRSAIRARAEAKQLARAATLAAWALARYPDDKATSKLASSLLVQADKQLYRLSVGCSPACSLLIDRKVTPFGETTRAVVYLEPGDHTVLASWGEERTRGEQVRGVAGEGREITLTAPPEKKREPPPVVSSAPVASSAPPPPPPPSGLPPAVFWGGLAVTAVVGGVTTWSALDMRADPGLAKVRADCAGLDESCPTYQRGIAAQRRTNLLLAATGGLAVVTGVVGLFTAWGDGEAKSGARGVPGVTPLVALGGLEGGRVGATGALVGVAGGF